MIKFKFTQLQENILRFLFIHTGESFNGRRLANLLGVSSPAISKSLNLLKKENLIILNKNKESNQLNVSLNMENPLIIGLKRSENIRMIYESGLVSFFEEEFPMCTIILFGSFSRGDDYYNSDIDFAIIGTKEKEINLKKFEGIFEKEIRINFYKHIKDINKNLKENILNGIVLSGGIDL